MPADRSVLSTVVGVLLAAAAVSAHHSPTEYDENKTVTLRGTINKVEWVNPHAKIIVDVKAPDGKVTTWSIETSTPSALFRQGVTKTSLPSGTAVVLTVWQARDGSLNGSGREITFPDGHSLSLKQN